jgi:hypothetical protein
MNSEEQVALELAAPAVLAKRRALKKHPLVFKSVDKFWSLVPKNPSGFLSKEVYLEFVLRLFKIINPDFVYEDALRTVEEDWLRDSKNEGSLSYDMFFNSVFELADVWCPDVSAPAYASFFAKVCSRHTRGLQEFVMEPCMYLLAACPGPTTSDC